MVRIVWWKRNVSKGASQKWKDERRKNDLTKREINKREETFGNKEKN